MNMNIIHIHFGALPVSKHDCTADSTAATVDLVGDFLLQSLVHLYSDQSRHDDNFPCVVTVRVEWPAFSSKPAYAGPRRLSANGNPS